jgi:hypothetical protein
MKFAAIGALSLSLAACTAMIEGEDPGGESGGNAGPGGGKSGGMSGGGTSSGGPLANNPPPYVPPPGMLRRLTRTQFRNAVRDVLGVEVDIDALDSDSYNEDFAVVGASTVVSSQRGVEQYHAAIESAVDVVFADSAKWAAFVGCTPTGAESDPCVRGFIEKLGLRVWRRPLEAAEIDRLARVSAFAATELEDPNEGPRWATVALLTSPNFLYRPELGVTQPDGSLRLSSYELASRLGFLLLNSLPDQALLEEAASGGLATTEAVREEAARLLDTPAGREAIGAFAEEYMRLDRLRSLAKDSALYPELTRTLKAAMIQDMRATWEAIAFDDRTSALSLFSTPKVVVNSELAALYGLDPAGLTPTTFEVRSLPADGPRAGILGKAAFLAQFANQHEGSPTLRGKFMRGALMCTPVSPPPGNVDTVLDEPPPDMPRTKRERLELHRTSAACAGCHALMDPLGLPLENFDAIGRYRTTDHGLTIDPSGEFEGKPVANARELGEAFGESQEVARCLVRKFYSYALGHAEREVDGSVLNALADSFEKSGFELRELVLDIVSQEAFSSVAPQPDLAAP